MIKYYIYNECDEQITLKTVDETSEYIIRAYGAAEIPHGEYVLSRASGDFKINQQTHSNNTKFKIETDYTFFPAEDPSL